MDVARPKPPMLPVQFQESGNAESLLNIFYYAGLCELFELHTKIRALKTCGITAVSSSSGEGLD
jgi:hypothetical protein